MDILVIGSGGREHALVWKLGQSPLAGRLWAAPGNGGTAAEARCENLPLPGLDAASARGMDFLASFAERERAALTVVGPEAPLAAGIVDRFRARGLAVAGPDESAARLESSKSFAKSFMEKYGVRHAKSASFTQLAGALESIDRHFSANNAPLVIKADGLAAGKGVVIAANAREARECAASFLEKRSLGEAGARIVLEEFLEGREVSVLAAVSVVKGRRGSIRPFLAARDHKRRFDGSRGPNTGGMGAIAPVPDFGAAAYRDFLASVMEPTLRGMEEEGMDYRGFLFFGLMVRDEKCFLLEYNARLGDPETQAVLPLMDADFARLCLSILDGSLGDFPLSWKTGAVCAPVAVASGYPGAYRKGGAISVNETRLAAAGAKVFFAGAERAHADSANSGAGLVVSGGRVLALSALGADAEDARVKAYEALKAVFFEGMDYRKDIGASSPAAGD
jgi:phosphoribosylamine--glycine ligase